MTMPFSILLPRKANRVPVLVTMGFLLCTCPWYRPNMRNAIAETPPHAHPQLEELSDELILDGVGLTGDAFSGLVILNLDKAQISCDCLDKSILLRCDASFQKRLCEQCKNPLSTFGAYVLLNTLYPDKRLNMVAGQIGNTTDGMRDVPIKMLSGDVVLRTSISKEQFGVIVYEYWRHQFGIKSEAELIYEQMLRKAEN